MADGVAQMRRKTGQPVLGGEVKLEEVGGQTESSQEGGAMV
jgi:hypothetical protein